MATKKIQKKAIPKNPLAYTIRSYRNELGENELVATTVQVGQTDLHILAAADVTELARDLVVSCRLQLENYGLDHPEFLSSLLPLPENPLAPAVVQEMLKAGWKAGVGPMAAVAGVVGRYVGEGLAAAGFLELVIENGGDIYLRRSRDCIVAIFAGSSPLSYTIGIRVPSKQMPCGVCTSSGTVGHSLSFGDADSVTVVADSVALADAAATRLGNEIGRGLPQKSAIAETLHLAERIQGIRGVLIICNDLMGAVGDIELVRL